MDIKKVIFEATEEVLGLSEEDMADQMDMDLWEEGLLDSVGVAAMMTVIEDRLHITLDSKDFEPEDLSTLNSILAVIRRVAGK